MFFKKSIYIYSNILCMWLRLVQNSSKLYSYTKKQRCFHKREGGGRNLLYRSQSIPPQSPSHETVKFHIMMMKTRNFFPSLIFLYLFYFLLLFFHFFFEKKFDSLRICGRTINFLPNIFVKHLRLSIYYFSESVSYW